jgi:hypothetical protein
VNSFEKENGLALLRSLWEDLLIESETGKFSSPRACPIVNAIAELLAEYADEKGFHEH